jgi:outer membrane lipoprotein-sorting protein
MKTSDINNLGNAYRSIYEAKTKEEEVSDNKDFKPHMMYDPETGKGYKAEKPEDHERMSKMGYTHEEPDMVKEKKLPRQMLDPKKDVMVVKNNKVLVVDKSKEKEYLKKGWGLAEQKKQYPLNNKRQSP